MQGKPKEDFENMVEVYDAAPPQGASAEPIVDRETKPKIRDAKKAPAKP